LVIMSVLSSLVLAALPLAAPGPVVLDMAPTPAQKAAEEKKEDAKQDEGKRKTKGIVLAHKPVPNYQFFRQRPCREVQRPF
jgi:hypothetical protein